VEKMDVSKAPALQHLLSLQRFQKSIVRNISDVLVFPPAFLSFFVADKTFFGSCVCGVFWIIASKMVNPWKVFPETE